MAATYHPRPLTLVASVPMTKHLAALIALGDGRVVEGLAGTYDALTFHIASGAAIVNRTSPRAAYYVTLSAPVDATLTNNATNYLWLSYDASIVVTTSSTQPADTIPLYIAVTSGGVVTGTPTDVRSTVLDLNAIVKLNGANLDGNEITNVGAPLSGSSAARLQDVIAGAPSVRDPVRAATTAAITLSGLQTVDGVVLVSQDRVLVKNQAAGATNGTYVAQTGAWVRATDFDASGDISPGVLIPVSEGTVNGNSVFGLDTDGPIVLGTTALTFTRRDVGAHELLTTAHSAVSAPTPSRIIIRDGAGRAQVADGSAAGDIATKGQMDTAVASEAATRSAADSSEAGTRAAADSAESAARSNGDAAAISTAEAYSVQRANHTGTQLAATVSNFDTQVRTSRLDQMAAPTADVGMNNRKLTDVAAGTTTADAVNYGQVPGLGAAPKSRYAAIAEGATTYDFEFSGGSNSNIGRTALMNAIVPYFTPGRADASAGGLLTTGSIVRSMFYIKSLDNSGTSSIATYLMKSGDASTCVQMTFFDAAHATKPSNIEITSIRDSDGGTDTDTLADWTLLTNDRWEFIYTVQADSATASARTFDLTVKRNGSTVLTKTARRYPNATSVAVDRGFQGALIGGATKHFINSPAYGQYVPA